MPSKGLEVTVRTLARQDVVPPRRDQNTGRSQESASPSPGHLHNCTSTPRLRPGLCQFSGGIIPMQVGDLEIAFLVRIGLPIVVIECEVAIGSGIDLHMRDGLRVMRALGYAPQWHNRTRSYKERDLIDRRARLDCLATLIPLVGPVVVPCRTGGQIDAFCRLPLRGYRRDQERRAEHVLIPDLRPI